MFSIYPYICFVHEYRPTLKFGGDYLIEVAKTREFSIHFLLFVRKRCKKINWSLNSHLEISKNDF